jgi:hypothetical protein
MVAPVDVLVGEQIRTPDGRSIPLTELPDVRKVYAVGDGWLVETQDFITKVTGLWWVGQDGTPKQLHTGGLAYAVSPDGTTVAWAIGDLIQMADVVDGRLISREQTVGRRNMVPYAIAGEAVLLRDATTGDNGTLAHFDLWFPARGGYVPGPKPKHDVWGIGVAPDGTHLLAMAALGERRIDGREYCLALLDFDTLEPTRSVCGLQLFRETDAYVSPDGQNAFLDGAGGGLVLVDLSTVFDTKAAMAGMWEADGPVVWLDADTAVATGRSDSVTRISVNDPPDGMVNIPVRPLGQGERITVIRRMG